MTERPPKEPTSQPEKFNFQKEFMDQIKIFGPKFKALTKHFKAHNSIIISDNPDPRLDEEGREIAIPYRQVNLFKNKEGNWLITFSGRDVADPQRPEDLNQLVARLELEIDDSNGEVVIQNGKIESKHPKLYDEDRDRISLSRLVTQLDATLIFNGSNLIINELIKKPQTDNYQEIMNMIKDCIDLIPENYPSSEPSNSQPHSLRLENPARIIIAKNFELVDRKDINFRNKKANYN